jgi:OOP family OmpA-OmpF porin
VTAAVYFEFDRSGLRSDELPKLDALAARIKDRSFDRLDAVGYADRIGEEPYNDQLSRKRADAVVAYLVAKGLDAGRMRAEARGERESTAGGACKELGADDGKNRKLVDCLQRDRYVQIVLR